MEKKPTFLRGLRIHEVSLVDQGANQYAHIRLAKRQEPDADKDTNVPTNAAPDEDQAFFARIGKAIAKLFHVEKGAATYEEVKNNEEIYRGIYRITDAMSTSIGSILQDQEIDDEQRAKMIRETADQIANAIKTDIADKVHAAAPAPAPIVTAACSPEEAKKRLEDEPEENPEEDPPEPVTKGVIDMNFDTEKMTPEERKTLEDLQKRYGIDKPVPTAAPAAPAPAETTVDKAITDAIQEELATLRKYREQVEMEKLVDVAKKYEALGKKPEELANMLKGMKDAGQQLYDDMVSVLDEQLNLVQTSGLFGEIGKRGADKGTGAWQKIEACATEICKSRQGISWNAAIDEACMQHPELVREYEENR